MDRYLIAMILQGRLKHLSEFVAVFGFWLMQQHSKWNDMMVTNQPQKIVSKRVSRGFVQEVSLVQGFPGPTRDVSKSPAEFQQRSTQGSLGTGETYGESLRVGVREMLCAHIMVKVG